MTQGPLDRRALSEGRGFDLGVCRAMFYLFYAWQCYLYAPSAYVSLPDELWSPPFLLSSFGAPNQVGVIVATTVFYGFCLASAVGFMTRFSTAVAALLGGYLFGVINSYGHIDIHFCPMQMIAFILPFSRAGDHFSLDRLMRGGVRGEGHYQWTIFLCQLSLVSLMVTAGIQKVLGNWLEQPGHNMEYWIRYKYFADASVKGIELPGVLLKLTEYGPLMAGLGVFLLLSELGSPLALISRWKWARLSVIGSLFLMQLFLSVILKTLPSFPWLCAYFFFVPWTKIFRLFRKSEESVMIESSSKTGV